MALGDGLREEATLVGPLAWTAVTGVHEGDPLAKGDAPLEATYATSGAFGRQDRAWSLRAGADARSIRLS